MQLKFKSEINQNDNVKNIEFTVPVTVYDEEKFKVLAFDEPNTNLKSMIELSEDEINIHNSSSTIYLKYQQEHEFTFHLDHQGKLFELLW
ncbi:glutamyl-tRNA synthetase, partial [Mycoplasmopsis edwardii]